MICMACTLDHIYIYTYILYIHRSYHVYLYILHIYPNFIAFRWFRWAIFAAKFWYFKVASNWSTDPQAWRMFNSRPRRTLAAWKFDGCDVFFFSMQDDISPRKFMENEACQVGCHNFRGVPFFQLVRLDCIHFWHALLPTDRVKNVVLVTFESWRSLLSHCITFYSEALQLDGYTLQHVFTILHIPCLWTSSSNCINPPAQNNRTI